MLLVQIGALRYAYMRLGVVRAPPSSAFVSFGSYVNIPIAKLGEEPMVTEREVTYYSVRRHVVPALTNSPRSSPSCQHRRRGDPRRCSRSIYSRNKSFGCAA